MRVSPWPARYGLDGCLFHPGQHRTVPGNGGSASAGWGLRDLKPGSCCAQDPHPHAHWGSGLAPPASGARAARGSDRLSVAGQGGRSQGGPGSGSEERLGVLQMEKDETVSDSSPHIANIGRLVEVSGAPGRWVTPPPWFASDAVPQSLFPGVLAASLASFSQFPSRQGCSSHGLPWPPVSLSLLVWVQAGHSSGAPPTVPKHMLPEGSARET